MQFIQENWCNFVVIFFDCQIANLSKQIFQKYLQAALYFRGKGTDQVGDRVGQLADLLVALNDFLYFRLLICVFTVGKWALWS